MERQQFEECVRQQTDTIERIRQRAYDVHQSVNQMYGDGSLPYGYHLDMVAERVRNFGHLVCVVENDVLPLFFSAYFHDAIEDARLTYNDVKHEARQFLSEGQIPMAAEIVYALTNDKGRTRAERAGEKYYKGIRETPYAPFVKLCDRLANVTFSCSNDIGNNLRMKEVYKNEMMHFLGSINPRRDDVRFLVPHEMVVTMAELVIDDIEQEEKTLGAWWLNY